MIISLLFPLIVISLVILMDGQNMLHGLFWVIVGILNIPPYFSLQRSLATLKCLVYLVKSSSFLCLVVIRFIMPSIITISAFFLSLNDKEFSLIVSSNCRGLPLVLDSYSAFASILCCRPVVHCPNKNAYAFPRFV